MNGKFDINDTIIRRGTMREIYSIKEKSLLIIFYIILFSQIILMILY